MYFSKQASKDVNILPQCYPFPMPRNTVTTSSIASMESKDQKRTTPPPRPQRLPYAPTAKNIPKLKQYIVNSFASSAFNNTDVPFPSLKQEPFKLYLKSDAVPYAQHTPIPVPHHLKQRVKEQLDQDVERGILMRAPLNMPVEWCAPMIVVLKPDGSTRRTIDYQQLNKQCLRQTHYTHSPFNLASQIPPNTFKTVLDAVDGFHSVEV